MPQPAAAKPQTDRNAACLCQLPAAAEPQTELRDALIARPVA